ncbi:MAG: hypothetical protein HY791_35590 [Deltaproteobacteria bacterium]|nr:hypothetical protein [Deltaproteobacteria bacterium]
MGSDDLEPADHTEKLRPSTVAWLVAASPLLAGVAVGFLGLPFENGLIGWIFGALIGGTTVVPLGASALHLYRRSIDSKRPLSSSSLETSAAAAGRWAVVPVSAAIALAAATVPGQKGPAGALMLMLAIPLGLWVLSASVALQKLTLPAACRAIVEWRAQQLRLLAPRRPIRGEEKAELLATLSEGELNERSLALLRLSRGAPSELRPRLDARLEKDRDLLGELLEVCVSLRHRPPLGLLEGVARWAPEDSLPALCRILEFSGNAAEPALLTILSRCASIPDELLSALERVGTRRALEALVRPSTRKKVKSTSALESAVMTLQARWKGARGGLAVVEDVTLGGLSQVAEGGLALTDRRIPAQPDPPTGQST